MRHFKVLIGILIVAMLFAACGNQATEEVIPTEETQMEEEAPAEEASGTLSLAGSTTVQPVAELLAEAFMAANPGIEVTVAGGGSSTGVKSVAEGQVDIGNASREIKDSEMEENPELTPYAIALDGVAVVVHPDNPVSELTAEQVKAIFLGEIQNWSEVGGNDEMITVVSREEGSGTRATFDELALDEELPTDLAVIVSSNGNMVTTVSTTPNAIGYISFGYMDQTTKGVVVDGIEPTVANVQSGEYPVSRNLNMITMGEAEGLAKQFLDFAFSDEGQAIIVEEGFISVNPAEEADMEEPAEEEMGLSGSLSLAGSTTVQPVAELLAEAFMALYPEVEVTVAGGGSSTGVKSVAEGQVDIGNASREIKDSEMEEFPELNPYPIAKDGVAVVVHPDNPVSDLTPEQVKAIFLGEIQNWSEVGGNDEMITVVSREEGSGTRATFDELALDEELPTDLAVIVSSNGNMVTTVSTTPNAIGYISFGYMDETTKGIIVDGVAPSVDNVLSGEYGVSRNLNMITMGEAEGLAAAFLDYTFSPEGQAIVESEGFIAVADAAAAEEESMDLSGTLSLAGSTTVQPVAELLAEAFMALYPDVEVTVAGGGSSTGVKSVAEGQVDIGNASREIKDSEMEEFPELNPYPIAKDGVAVVVHPDNPVSDLTPEQVKAIFLGEIQNWSEVGGNDEMITVVSREEGSGTRATFDELALDEELPTDLAVIVSSNGNMVTTVSTTPNAIGYISFGYMDESTKGVAIDGVEPDVENVLSGEYGISRNLNMITMGEAEGLAAAFIEFVFSAEGQAIVESEGFIAIK